ncbi:hypothetical protein N7453_007612 [Penicillium expansum]|nr:hypothetical protein N7453_007612 [Penicillium expansum]
MLPPGPLKQDYDATRQDPTWYLRKQLVEDCIGRGGCCARGCDCCEDRAPAQFKKGVGHCTAGCSCCASERGFEHTAEEMQETVDQLDSMLRSRNPSYVIKMTEAYFVKPRQEEKVEKKKEREKRAREEKAWEERVQREKAEREKAQAQAQAEAQAEKGAEVKVQGIEVQEEKVQKKKVHWWKLIF